MFSNDPKWSKKVYHKFNKMAFIPRFTLGLVWSKIVHILTKKSSNWVRQCLVFFALSFHLVKSFHLLLIFSPYTPHLILISGASPSPHLVLVSTSFPLHLLIRYSSPHVLGTSPWSPHHFLPISFLSPLNISPSSSPLQTPPQIFPICFSKDTWRSIFSNLFIGRLCLISAIC